MWLQRFRTLSTPVRVIQWRCSAMHQRPLTSLRDGTVCTPFRATRAVASRTSLTAHRSWNRITPPSGLTWRCAEIELMRICLKLFTLVWDWWHSFCSYFKSLVSYSTHAKCFCFRASVTARTPVVTLTRVSWSTTVHRDITLTTSTFTTAVRRTILPATEPRLVRSGWYAK